MSLVAMPNLVAADGPLAPCLYWLPSRPAAQQDVGRLGHIDCKMRFLSAVLKFGRCYGFDHLTALCAVTPS